MQELVTRELTVRGSYGFREEFEQAADALAAGTIDVRPIIERLAPLEEGPELFRRAGGRRARRGQGRPDAERMTVRFAILGPGQGRPAPRRRPGPDPRCSPGRRFGPERGAGGALWPRPTVRASTTVSRPRSNAAASTRSSSARPTRSTPNRRSRRPGPASTSSSRSRWPSTVADADAMIAAAARPGSCCRSSASGAGTRRSAGSRTRSTAGESASPGWRRSRSSAGGEPTTTRWMPGAGPQAGEGGGVLVNQAVHQLDLLRWFLGPVAEVDAWTSNVNHPELEVEDTVVAAIRFVERRAGLVRREQLAAAGPHANVHVHGATAPRWGSRPTPARRSSRASRCRARRGTTSGRSPARRRRRNAGPAEDAAALAGVDQATHHHELQLRDVVAAIRDGRPPAVDGADGRATVELLEAIYRAAGTGERVTSPPWRRPGAT